MVGRKPLRRAKLVRRRKVRGWRRRLTNTLSLHERQRRRTRKRRSAILACHFIRVRSTQRAPQTDRELAVRIHRVLFSPVQSDHGPRPRLRSIAFLLILVAIGMAGKMSLLDCAGAAQRDAQNDEQWMRFLEIG